MSNALFIFTMSLAALSWGQSGPSYQEMQGRLDQLIKQALENNPQIKAYRYRADAQQAGAARTSSLDPPQVSMDFFQTPVKSFPNPFKDQMEVDYSVQQTLPFPGKRSIMSAAEKSRSAMMYSEAVTVQQDVITRLKSAYYELYLVFRKREINAETQCVMKNLAEIVRKQYEQGIGRPADVIRAQTGLSQLAKETIVLDEEQKKAETMINALLNRPLDQSMDFLPEITPEIISLNYGRLCTLAVQNRPELAAMQFTIAMQEAEAGAAYREYYPDLMVRGMYKQMMDADDYWSIMLGMDVPIAFWSKKKYAATYTESSLKTEQARAQYTDMRNMMLAQVREAFLGLASSQEQAKLYAGTIMPQTEQAFKSTLAAYETGQTDYMNLVESQKMLLEAKLDYQMTVMKLFETRTQLERAVGQGLNEMRSNQ